MAAILGAIGVLGIWKIFSASEGGEAESMESVPVLVAVRYVPAFDILGPRSIGLKNIPRGVVPPGTLHSTDEVLDSHGRPLYTAAVALPEGQFISRTLLTEVSKNHSLTPFLQPNQVAVSFAVDRMRGAGGWIQPGDRIAIFQTQGVEEFGRKPLTTQLLLPGLTVLAVDNHRLGDAEKDSNARGGFLQDSEQQDQASIVLTVRANPLEATTLIQAQEQGRLTAILRAAGEDQMEDEIHGK